MIIVSVVCVIYDIIFKRVIIKFVDCNFSICYVWIIFNIVVFFIYFIVGCI